MTGAVPDFELQVWRFGVLTLFVLPRYIIYRELPKIKTRDIPWMVLYCIGVLGINLTFFMSVKFLPLGAVGCVQRAFLFLCIVIMAKIFLKERIHAMKMLAVVLCVVGATLVSQPDFMFSKLNESSDVRASAAGNDSMEGMEMLDSQTDFIYHQVGTNAVGNNSLGAMEVLTTDHKAKDNNLSDVTALEITEVSHVNFGRISL